jgi:hypothetical protein
LERLETHTHHRRHTHTHTHKQEKEKWITVKGCVEQLKKLRNFLIKNFFFQVKEGLPEDSKFRNQKSPKIPSLKRSFSKVLLP